MPGASAGPDVRPCRLGDAGQLSRLLKASWHAAYDPILGEREARRRGQPVYSPLALALWIGRSSMSPHALKMLVATRGDAAAGMAMVQRDAAETVLNMLYVDPELKGRGIGSTLLRAAIGCFAETSSIRVEVLKDNVAAIAWYKARGFEVYGEGSNATGMPGVAALYLDMKLDRLTHG